MADMFTILKFVTVVWGCFVLIVSTREYLKQTWCQENTISFSVKQKHVTLRLFSKLKVWSPPSPKRRNTVYSDTPSHAERPASYTIHVKSIMTVLNRRWIQCLRKMDSIYLQGEAHYTVHTAVIAIKRGGGGAQKNQSCEYFRSSLTTCQVSVEIRTKDKKSVTGWGRILEIWHDHFSGKYWSRHEIFSGKRQLL